MNELTPEQYEKLLRILKLDVEIIEDLEEAAKYRLARKLIWKTKRQMIIGIAALVAAIALLWEKVLILAAFFFKTGHNP